MDRAATIAVALAILQAAFALITAWWLAWVARRERERGARAERLIRAIDHTLQNEAARARWLLAWASGAPNAGYFSTQYGADVYPYRDEALLGDLDVLVEYDKAFLDIMAQREAGRTEWGDEISYLIGPPQSAYRRALQTQRERVLDGGIPQLLTQEELSNAVRARRDLLAAARRRYGAPDDGRTMGLEAL